MARPQKQTVDYFPHDASACAGDTLTVLQSRFGNDGYAFWFKLLEKLAGTDGHCVDCSNPTKWQLFVAKMGVDEITTVEIMKVLVEMQAIDKDLWDSKLIWCQRLVDNVADVYKNRRRQVPQKPVTTNLNGITTGDKPITTDESTQSKVKESKVNNIKDTPSKKEYGEFKNVFLTDEEYNKLCGKFETVGANERIETLSTGIASKGYKYKSHYAAILAWDRRDKAKEASHERTGKDRGHTRNIGDRTRYKREDYQ